MMHILFVDDEFGDASSSASIAADALDTNADYSVHRADFTDVIERLESRAPDLIVMDLQEEVEPGNARFPGADSIAWVWENRFCPIVVYSGFPDQLSDSYSAHPFVKVIKKGSRSVNQLEEAIVSLLPQIESIQAAEDYMKKEFSIAMREVAPYAFETFQDATRRTETITRSGRRRFAARMDGPSGHGDKLVGWEQYLFPPVSDDLLLGDLIRVSEGSSDDPSSFRVVLTPSCDLSREGGRTPNVEVVLVARCSPIKDALARINKWSSDQRLDTESKRKKFQAKIETDVLTQGYSGSIMPLPCLEGKVPTMAADMRKLELIPIDQIGSGDSRYLRIASVDSPFRELISWAYMQNGCRPGLPGRDFSQWANEIVTNLEPGT